MVLNSHGKLQTGETQMKLTKLLTGVAGAALLAGTAYGQVESDLVREGGLAETDLASELDVSGLANQTLQIFVAPVDALGAQDPEGFAAFDGSEATVTLSLTGAIFPTTLTDGQFPDLNGCDPDIVSGGAAGDSEVVFSVADIGACDLDGGDGAGGGADGDFEGAAAATPADAVLYFDIPLQLTATDANVSVSVVQTSNGAAITTATYERAAPLVFSTISKDTLVASLPGFLLDVAATDRTALLSATGVSFNTLSGGGAIGVIDPDNLAVDVDLAGTAADWDSTAQVDEFEVIVSVENPTGFASVTLLADNDDATTVALSGGSATFTIDGTASAGVDVGELADDLTVILNEDTDDATLIQEGTFSIAVSVDEASGSDLTIGGDSDSGEISRQGSSSALFEWFGDTTTPTNQIIRAVGFDPDEDLPNISFTVSNATIDDSDAVNKEYPLGAYTVSDGGELIITQQMLRDVIGADWGRADIRFFAEAAGIEFRRFQVTNGVVTLGHDN